jgi:O-antigen biosynthesis protein WbqP
MMKRLLDILISIVFLTLFFIPFLIIAVFVLKTSPGPVLYWSVRVGQGGEFFNMPKFRTMLLDTPVIATHLMENPNAYIPNIGQFLRRTSIDELPQLWSILKGDMSFVGPRPALFNQDDLIALRKEQGVDRLVPGLTGLAQVNGRDELPISQKVQLDLEYMERQSFLFDMKILWMTVFKVFRRDGVAH